MADQHLKGTDNIFVAQEIANIHSSIQQLAASMATLVQPTRVPAVDPDHYREREPWVNLPEPPPFPPILRHKPAPVEFGRFYGINPETWIFQVERYFYFYRIVDDHKFSTALFYLDGDALEWYRWLYRNKQLIDWD